VAARKQGILYRSFIRLASLFAHGELRGREHLPTDGPAVLVANHIGSRGPPILLLTIPLEIYPWVAEGTLDLKTAPNYVRLDVVEPQWGLRPPLSVAVAHLCAWFSHPLLRGSGAIAVHNNRPLYGGAVTFSNGLRATIEDSIELLEQNKLLLIFPEDPAAEVADERTGMRRWAPSFVRLAEEMNRRHGVALPYYPVAVHPSRRVMVGEAVRYDPAAPRKAEDRARLMGALWRRRAL